MDIVVEVNEGILRGKASLNYKNGRFFSFFGIPYALPPIGNLRFKAPQPPTKWMGVMDATKEKEGCISRNTFTQNIEGGEDCLFLNVYSSMRFTKSETLKPVMVWVHGGAFVMGSTKTDLYGPEYLLTEDIVLITVSYRLGALGFICLEDTTLGVTGNNGLRDVLMALKWVQKNIKAFLGDANNVTLFGESSGGVMCHYLMLSPLGKGLFHKIILQSGNALYIWSEGARNSARELAKVLGLVSDNDKEILEFLQQQPVDLLFEAQEKVKAIISPHIKRHFYPVFENYSNLEAPVISENPFRIILKGEYNKVPMIIGYTSDEGLFFDYKIKAITKRNQTEPLITDFENLIPFQLNIGKGTVLSKYIANEIKSFYFNGQLPVLKDRQKVYELYADLYFIQQAHNTASMHFESLSYPIYCFKFSVDAGFNFYKKLHGVNFPGASHSDDVCYLFKVGSHVKEVVENSLEDITIQRMVKLWTNFARTGNPNNHELDQIISTEWKPIKAGKLYFLNIGKYLTIEDSPDKEKVEFWNNIYKMCSYVNKL